jgi:hypothetical protein
MKRFSEPSRWGECFHDRGMLLRQLEIPTKVKAKETLLRPVVPPR